MILKNHSTVLAGHFLQIHHLPKGMAAQNVREKQPVTLPGPAGHAVMSDVRKKKGAPKNHKIDSINDLSKRLGTRPRGGLGIRKLFKLTKRSSWAPPGDDRQRLRRD